ncbi:MULTISPECIES: zinc ribbon domain-containing protein [Nonomuraea]|uniref:Zinc ribbon domain-containing protein n=1 Tax=Nonomuraea salmonea TaxID=46181 RepID=A0ABV5P0J0_9ACTN
MSKLCGKCGVVNSSLTLAERVWPCTCGTVHDQDVNAARNLLAAMTLKQQAA